MDAVDTEVAVPMVSDEISLNPLEAQRFQWAVSEEFLGNEDEIEKLLLAYGELLGSHRHLHNIDDDCFASRHKIRPTTFSNRTRTI